MSKPDAGIQVHRRGNFPNVKAVDVVSQECAYAKIEHWSPCPCGQRAVTRRSDLTFGCVRCGRDRRHD